MALQLQKKQIQFYAAFFAPKGQGSPVFSIQETQKALRLRNIPNGGTLYFKVAPYFSGSTGTYLLDLTITRSAITGIEDVETNAQISLYPNPAEDFVTIDLHEFTNKINKIALCDVQGRLIYSENSANFERTINLPLTDVSNGVYFVQIIQIKEF